MVLLEKSLYPATHVVCAYIYYHVRVVGEYRRRAGEAGGTYSGVALPTHVNDSLPVGARDLGQHSIHVEQERS